VYQCSSGVTGEPGASVQSHVVQEIRLGLGFVDLKMPNALERLLKQESVMLQLDVLVNGELGSHGLYALNLVVEE